MEKFENPALFLRLSPSPKLIRHGNGAVFENALHTLKTKFEDWRRLCVFGCVWKIFKGRSLSKSVISQSGDDHWLLRSQIFPAYSVEGNHIWCVNFQSSLRSKRFRWVWENRQTEEWDFRCFSRAKNGARSKKRKRGMGEGKEGKSRSSDFLCSPTPQKRLLRRLFLEWKRRFQVSLASVDWALLFCVRKLLQFEM